MHIGPGQWSTSVAVSDKHLHTDWRFVYLNSSMSNQELLEKEMLQWPSMTLNQSQA